MKHPLAPPLDAHIILRKNKALRCELLAGSTHWAPILWDVLMFLAWRQEQTRGGDG